MSACSANEAPQHPGHVALLAVTDGLVRAVVEHHEPHPEMSRHFPGQVAYWQCHGCDPGPHAEDHADWPCSTAELIAQQVGLPPLDR